MKAAVWGLVVILAGVVTGAWMSQKPWKEMREQRAQAHAADQEMRRVESERNTLVREAARLDTPAGRERLARERGYRKPGESAPDEVR